VRTYNDEKFTRKIDVEVLGMNEEELLKKLKNIIEFETDRKIKHLQLLNIIDNY
jgi:hypothetical protein